MLLIGASAGLTAGSGERGALAQGKETAAGHALFVEKQCARCHAPRGEPGLGPVLEALRKPQGEMELAGRLWNHVPEMMATLAREGLEWPRISAAEMVDLMAYLQADPVRDREPDLSRGQVTLIKKGCLKCHSLRREGGRVPPDLAERRADYDSAAAWAATMWTHTPAMAALARRHGLPYPRFSGDEMGNLVGFLRRASLPAPPGQ